MTTWPNSHVFTLHLIQINPVFSTSNNIYFNLISLTFVSFRIFGTSACYRKIYILTKFHLIFFLFHIFNCYILQNAAIILVLWNELDINEHLPFYINSTFVSSIFFISRIFNWYVGIMTKNSIYVFNFKTS